MSKCYCSSDNCCQPQPKKPINIHILYLDTTVCGRYQDTEKALDDAILREVYSSEQREPERKAYQLSENIETYFTAKAHKDEVERQEKGGKTI